MNKESEKQMVHIKESRREIGLFLVVVFLLPLLCIGLMRVPVIGSGPIYFILFGIEAASPTVAALVCQFAKGGKTAVYDFITKRYKKNFCLKMCFLAFILPMLFLWGAKAFGVYLGVMVDRSTVLSLKKVLIISWALVAEELGWRGYLQEKLEESFDKKEVPLIVGMVWALWHYHFFLSGSMAVPLLAFTYGCITESYGYAVLMHHAKGNIIPASIWHFSGNLFFNLFCFGASYQNGSNRPYWVASLCYTIWVIIYFMDEKQRKYHIPLE